MYEGIKKSFGSQISKSAPIKSSFGETLKDRGKPMERCPEHLRELYSKDFKISNQVIQNIQSIPILDELDSLPTLEELRRTVDFLACAKAPENDAIPSEILKVGKSVFFSSLHELLL